MYWKSLILRRGTLLMTCLNRKTMHEVQKAVLSRMALWTTNVCDKYAVSTSYTCSTIGQIRCANCTALDTFANDYTFMFFFVNRCNRNRCILFYPSSRHQLPCRQLACKSATVIKIMGHIVATNSADRMILLPSWTVVLLWWCTCLLGKQYEILRCFDQVNPSLESTCKGI